MPNSGYLARNTQKNVRGPNPEYTGKATIDGVAYIVDGWVRTNESGGKYVSLSFIKSVNQPKKEK